MQIGVITLFPEMFAALNLGVVGRAIDAGRLTLYFFNPRDFSDDANRRVDDRPYGGGPGMVLQFMPLKRAVMAAKEILPQAQVVYLSPQGAVLRQATVEKWSEVASVILVAGRYEGVDERFIQQCVDVECSVGDYVVSGGELPAMVLIDAMARCLPGVLGHADSAASDSFSNGLLDCPHYTRPESVEGLQVPDVLLSGDHEKIKKWRHEQSVLRTRLRRKDLLEQANLLE